MSDIVGRLRSAAADVLAGEPVKVAYLFGSHARGEGRPDSDVDVAVLAPDVVAHDAMDLHLRVLRRLSTASRVPALDVIVLDEAPLTLSGRVVKDGIVIYSVDEALRIAYESRVFRESVDFSFFGDAFAREALRLTAEGRR